MSTESVREKILDAALECFSRNGFQGTSIDEIATECGMKAPNLYKYFKSKDAILAAIANISEEGYRMRMMMNPESMVWIHNAAELKMFTMHQVMFTLNDEKASKLRKVCAIEQFRNEIFRRRLTEHQYENIRALYERIFKELIGFGAIDDCDVGMLTIEYIAPISIYVQLCDREPERRDEFLKLMEQYVDFFIAKTLKV